MRIQAALLAAVNQPFQIESLDLQAPHAGEVLVRVGACGVCHSDYHLVTGATKHPLPVVPGHEGAGVVEAVGEDVTGIQPGDHVILNWAPHCGRCFYCLRGKPNLCETFIGPVWRGVMLDGTPRLSWRDAPVYHFCALAAFAEYVVIPQASCVVIRRDVPLTVAALVGCAVTTGFGAVQYTAQVQVGDRVAVFGCGGVGLSIVMSARLAGAQQIIAIDRVQSKLELARRFGATHTVHADGADVVGVVRQMTDGRGADVAFEAVGAPQLQVDCVRAARPGGKAVFVGLSPVGSVTPLSGAAIARQEKVVLGSYYGSASTARDFPLLLDLYAAGKLELDALVSRTYRLAEVNQAFEAMLGGDVARGVVVLA
jgi:S-(hydroxymethyl)glutathione dehydrogenase/alcohol dehydrogenase